MLRGQEFDISGLRRERESSGALRKREEGGKLYTQGEAASGQDAGDT